MSGEVGSEDVDRRIREIVEKASSSAELDVFSEFLKVISRRFEATPTGETLITKSPRKVEVISGSELDEFLKYCRDFEAAVGIDVRALLSLIRGDMNYIKLCFKKNDVEVDISWWRSTYRRELTATFKTPKITRNFLIFNEETSYW